MRIAIIADIHGNVLALDAVLADIAARGIAQIVNLGDIVSGPLWPRETLDRLADIAMPTVRGNHDRWVSEGDATTLGASDRSPISNWVQRSGLRSVHYLARWTWVTAFLDFMQRRATIIGIWSRLYAVAFWSAMRSPTSRRGYVTRRPKSCCAGTATILSSFNCPPDLSFSTPAASAALPTTIRTARRMSPRPDRRTRAMRC